MWREIMEWRPLFLRRHVMFYSMARVIVDGVADSSLRGYGSDLFLFLSFLRSFWPQASLWAFMVVAVVVDRFCTALFSALEQTHYSHDSA